VKSHYPNPAWRDWAILESSFRDEDETRVALTATSARPKPSEWNVANSAFTLIEIMIVVAIMAVIMGMTIPFARQALHKEALDKAIDDVREVCQSARTLAIMRGSMTEVVFHGRDGRFEVAGAGAGEAKDLGAAPQASGMSGQLADDLAFAALRINGVDILKLGEADVARVRFYPNGTCDELRLVLLRSTTSESRGLFLEITTGLVTIESDRWKLAQEIR
jgi:prepilin-type N-terminal cleavage/methylation domain-containing protein